MTKEVKFINYTTRSNVDQPYYWYSDKETLIEDLCLSSAADIVEIEVTVRVKE